MIRLTEAIPKILASRHENFLKITADQLRDAITDKTRMLILNSPNNPSGAVYNERELRALAEVLLEHPNITVVSGRYLRAHTVWWQKLCQHCQRLPRTP